MNQTMPKSTINTFSFLKADMKVQIISKQIIKPSSSTPLHLRTYKLSLLDQLAPPTYTPIILFYSSPTTENSCQTSNQLKKSLSKTLTHFYPFAGRIKDELSIDCNDEGATFIEAQVAGEMSMVTQEPDIHKLQQLLPCSPNEKSPELSTQVMLAAQVNYFNCGGLAISVCIWHAIADASASATFVNSWAAITCGAAIDTDGVIFYCTSLFPPQNLSGFSLRDYVKEDALSEVMMKRFLFDGTKVSALREEIGNIGPCLDRPTRVEALSALILGAVMAVSGEGNEAAKINAATMAVDVRKRMIPPLPKQSIGSSFQVAIATWAENDIINKDYGCIAGRLHESIKKMDNDYIRKVHAGGGYFKFVKKASEELGKSPDKLKVFGFSSWCKFPFYEADFGWGKPIWLGNGLSLNKVAIFLDTRDGEGIEAWVGLSKELMVKFEKHPGILSYASFWPSI